MTDSMDLRNKTIVVTGASSGIGKTTAIRLSELNAKVILIARNEEKLKETLSSLTGKGHSYYVFDLQNISGIENLLKEIVEKNGKLNGFVHCAGIVELRPIKLVSYESLHKIMMTNFYSFVEFVRVYSNKRYNSGGSIVVMSSVAGKVGMKSLTAYSASKAAVDGAVRVMAKELAEKNIRVNSVAAGFINTNMTEEYLGKTSEETVNREIFSRQFMGAGETEDIANVIAFLISDLSKFITGTGLTADGGYLT